VWNEADLHEQFVTALGESMSLLIHTSDQAFHPVSLVQEEQREPPDYATEMHNVNEQMEKQKCKNLEALLKENDKVFMTDEAFHQANPDEKKPDKKNYGLPGFHALDVISRLYPCLEEVNELAGVVNDYMAKSKKSNEDYYDGFKRIFRTMHMLKESKLERMFRQQHERVWKILINHAMQIQTVLEALYNPMMPGKGYFTDEHTNEVIVRKDKQLDELRKLYATNESMTERMTPMQKKLPLSIYLHDADSRYAPVLEPGEHLNVSGGTP
jgi:hypothetical protein